MSRSGRIALVVVALALSACSPSSRPWTTSVCRRDARQLTRHRRANGEALDILSFRQGRVAGYMSATTF